MGQEDTLAVSLTWVFLLHWQCLGKKWRMETCTGSENGAERELMHIKCLPCARHCVQHFKYADPSIL